MLFLKDDLFKRWYNCWYVVDTLWQTSIKNMLRWYPKQQERIHSSVMCLGVLNISNLHMGALFCSWASKTLQNLRLALDSPEPLHLPPPPTLRNFLKPPAPSETLQNSGTCTSTRRNLAEPCGTLRNPPEPSGTCACDRHRRTPELIWAIQTPLAYAVGEKHKISTTRCCLAHLICCLSHQRIPARRSAQGQGHLTRCHLVKFWTWLVSWSYIVFSCFFMLFLVYFGWSCFHPISSPKLQVWQGLHCVRKGQGTVHLEAGQIAKECSYTETLGEVFFQVLCVSFQLQKILNPNFFNAGFDAPLQSFIMFNEFYFQVVSTWHRHRFVSKTPETFLSVKRNRCCKVKRYSTSAFSEASCQNTRDGTSAKVDTLWIDEMMKPTLDV